MERTRLTFTLDTTINDIVTLEPDSLQVLNALGIDTCCGGGSSLREAAQDAGAVPEQVLEALRQRTARL